MPDPGIMAGLILDAALGWPALLYRFLGHPVGLFARCILWCEHAWNKPSRSAVIRRISGIMTVLLLLLMTVGGAGLLEKMAWDHLGPWAWIATALLAWPALAQRSLYTHVHPVAVFLRKGDTEGARSAVSQIVGRDTDDLDEAGVARAAIESLAESFCDGVVAPLFWLIIGGLPGIWAYKAINTADSLIGHKEARWRHFGWAAARTDDVLNLIPARLSAAILCAAGGTGWSTLWRDHKRHASPNSGWPEAAMAGALGLKLAGPLRYDGVTYAKEWIGSGRTNARAEDVERALSLYLRACLLLWLITAVLIWGSWQWAH